MLQPAVALSHHHGQEGVIVHRRRRAEERDLPFAYAAQVGAQAAQGGDAGDDAGLFGEGWECNWRFNQDSLIQIRHC